jgi:hypothetical protein
MIDIFDRLPRPPGLSGLARPDATILVILLSVTASAGAFAIIGLEAAVCTLATALALSSRLPGMWAVVSPAVTILVILLSAAASIGALAVIDLQAAVCTFASALAPVSC